MRVPRRRVRRQILVVAAHSAGRARRESGEPAGPPAAHPRTDVLDGRVIRRRPFRRSLSAPTSDGKLSGIRHDSVNPTSVFDDYVEYAAMASRHLWRASGGISTSHKVVHVNRNSPVVLRAPMEAQGHFALESAMDELAYATGVDPVELRLRNDTDTDPYSGRPFSTRALRECLTEGAARFGWDKRSPEPRSMRDGRYLIGQGVAAAIYTHWRWPGKARVTLNGDGSVLVEAAAHDIGTGTYTVMAQVAADALGLTPDSVTVRLGDTRLPESHPAIGSATTANATAAVMLAAQAARDKAIELALTGRDAPFAGAAPDDVMVADGRLSLARTNLNITYAELLARNSLVHAFGRWRLQSSRGGEWTESDLQLLGRICRSTRRP